MSFSYIISNMNLLSALINDMCVCQDLKVIICPHVASHSIHACIHTPRSN
jgi:hypothetical protein